MPEIAQPMALDLPTLVITEALILIQLAALVYVAGVRMRDIFRGPTFWALGLFCFAASQLLFIWLDSPEHGPHQLLNHLPAALGCCAVLIGFDDFADRGRNWRGIGALAGLALCDFLLQSFWWSSYALRVTTFGSVQILFVLLLLPRLYQPVSGQRRLGFKLMRMLAWGWGAINLARIICVLFSPEQYSAINQVVQLSYFVMALFFGVWLALCCWLLMHERLSAGLIHATTRDALTGSHNRRGFSALLSQESHRLVRQWSSTAVLRVAIDDYPSLLRRYGGQAGDRALMAFAEAVQEELRDVDGLARLGAEQFAVLLLNADEAGAKVVAERLRRRIQDLVVYTPAGPIWFTASFGIAVLPELENELELVLKQAEQALQAARAAGSNRICLLPLPSLQAA